MAGVPAKPGALGKTGSMASFFYLSVCRNYRNADRTAMVFKIYNNVIFVQSLVALVS